MARENFVFYGSWLDIIESQYPDDVEKQMELVFSIVQYGINEVKTFPMEKMFLLQTQAQIDSAKAKHQKRVEAGRRGGQKSKGGGAPKGNKNASFAKNNKQQQANDNDNVNDNVNDNDNIIIRESKDSPNNPSSEVPLEGHSSKEVVILNDVGMDPEELWRRYKAGEFDDATD